MARSQSQTRSTVIAKKKEQLNVDTAWANSGDAVLSRVRILAESLRSLRVIELHADS